MTLKSSAPCHNRRTLWLFRLAKDCLHINQASRVEMSNIMLQIREKVYGQIHHTSHLSLKKQEQGSQGIVSKGLQRSSKTMSIWQVPVQHHKESWKAAEHTTVECPSAFGSPSMQT